MQQDAARCLPFDRCSCCKLKWTNEIFRFFLCRPQSDIVFSDRCRPDALRQPTHKSNFWSVWCVCRSIVQQIALIAFRTTPHTLRSGIPTCNIWMLELSTILDRVCLLVLINWTGRFLTYFEAFSNTIELLASFFQSTLIVLGVFVPFRCVCVCANQQVSLSNQRAVCLPVKVFRQQFEWPSFLSENNQAKKNSPTNWPVLRQAQSISSSSVSKGPLKVIFFSVKWLLIVLNCVCSNSRTIWVYFRWKWQIYN